MIFQCRSGEGDFLISVPAVKENSGGSGGWDIRFCSVVAARRSLWRVSSFRSSSVA